MQCRADMAWQISPKRKSLAQPSHICMACIGDNNCRGLLRLGRVQQLCCPGLPYANTAAHLFCIPCYSASNIDKSVSFHTHESCKPCKTGEADTRTWVLCQSPHQPAGRDAHAGDAPPESTEDLQRIQTLGQRPRVDAKVFKQTFNFCTDWGWQEVLPRLCSALYSVSVLSVRCARHFTDIS